MDNAELAEMEKMLNSGSYPHQLSKSIKHARDEIAAETETEHTPITNPSSEVINNKQSKKDEQVAKVSENGVSGVLPGI